MLNAEAKTKELVELFSSSRPLDRAAIRQELVEIRNEIHQVATSVIDYQVVVDNMDDNILISDPEEKIIYINPAYEKHTGIPKEALLGRRVSDVVKEKKYFTTATIPDVIKRKERVMKLSYMSKNQNPGIVVGTPVFDPHVMPGRPDKILRFSTAHADNDIKMIILDIFNELHSCFSRQRYFLIIDKLVMDFFFLVLSVPSLHFRRVFEIMPGEFLVKAGRGA